MSTGKKNLIKGEFPNNKAGKRELFNLIKEGVSMDVAQKKGIKIDWEGGLDEMDLSWGGVFVATKHKPTGWIMNINHKLKFAYNEWSKKEKKLVKKMEKGIASFVKKISNKKSRLLEVIKSSEDFKKVAEFYSKDIFDHFTNIKELKEQKSYGEYQKWIDEDSELEDGIYWNDNILWEFETCKEVKTIKDWYELNESEYQDNNLEELLDEVRNELGKNVVAEAKKIALKNIKLKWDDIYIEHSSVLGEIGNE